MRKSVTEPVSAPQLSKTISVSPSDKVKSVVRMQFLIV